MCQCRDGLCFSAGNHQSLVWCGTKPPHAVHLAVMRQLLAWTMRSEVAPLKLSRDVHCTVPAALQVVFKCVNICVAVASEYAMQCILPSATPSNTFCSAACRDSDPGTCHRAQMAY